MKVKTVTIPKVEKRVIANAKLLDEKWPDLIKNNQDKLGCYVVFHNGCTILTESNIFAEALSIGDQKFGRSAGFVVRKLTDKIPIVGGPEVCKAKGFKL